MRSSRFLVIALAAVVGACVISGCGSSGGDIAIVVGAHANSPKPVLTDQVADEIKPALGGDSHYSIISSDGRPESEGTFDAHVNDANDLTYSKSTRELIDKLRTDVAAVRAKNPENDLISAIALGARAVSSSRGQRTLVVLDSGLQTTGALVFQSNDGALLGGEPTSIAKEISPNLPNLSGVRVVFSGLGDVTSPQQPLLQVQHNRLIDIWEAVIRQAGGTPVVLQAPASGSSESGLPKVSVVPVGNEAPPTLDRPVSLLDKVTGFEPNTADFVDIQATRINLEEYAKAILVDGRKFLLTGTTTDDQDEQFRMKLSIERAQAVKALLVELGVPDDRLRVIGVGSSFSGFVPDRDPSGKIDERLAPANRRVIISAEE